MNIIKRIEMALHKFNDDEDTIQEINEIISESNGEMNIDEIMGWFESPFVSEFDKNSVIEKLKTKGIWNK